MKRYKTRLHFKRHSYLRYLFFPLNIFLLYGGMKYFNNHIDDLRIFKYQIPYEYLLGTLISAIFSVFIIWLLSPLSPFKSQRMRHKLKDIIEINKFYYLADNTTRIRNSMVFKYWWEESRFYLRVYPYGGKWTTKTNELTEILESSFNMILETVDDAEPNFTLYVFNTERIERIDTTEKWSE